MKPGRRTFIRTAPAALLATLSAGLPGRILASAFGGGVDVFTAPAFGSGVRLVLPASSENARARRIVREVVRSVDAAMSPFRHDSDLGRFNAAAKSVTVSGPTRAVAEFALALAKQSDGAFDPTLMPIARRFGFGPGLISPDRPAGITGGAVDGISLVGNELQKSNPGLSLDLCAVAKGYALEQMTRRLDGADYLLELGGEVAASGRHPSGRKWLAGIEGPDGVFMAAKIPAGGFVATSGDMHNGYGVPGRRVFHIIDPRTKRSPDGTRLASVLAPNAMIADGLATALMVSGPEKGRELLRQYDASALVLAWDESLGLQETDINHFRKRMGA